MNQKPRTTTRQALKRALKDVGGVILYGLLFAAGTGIVLGGGWAMNALLGRYYPAHTQVMAILTCMMVPGLIVLSEVLIRARNLLGDDAPRQQQRRLDAAILVMQVVQIATTFALVWMVYHSPDIPAGFMLPVMVVCAIVQAVSSFIRIRMSRAAW